MSPPLYIGIPAWGEFYVNLACKYTIPAALASVRESSFNDVTFLIHCHRHEQDAYRQAVGEHKVQFLSLKPMSPLQNGGKVRSLPHDHWNAFKTAHREDIESTERGAVISLLNSDIVVSREWFTHVAAEIDNGKKVVASVGIRTSIDDWKSEPPIGVSADDLSKWIWENPHHITKECVWGTGRSHHPTIMFFEDGNGLAMHCFHLTPMALLKDRKLAFKGTIDDDLLGKYSEDEISYTSNGEAAVAELSPNWKTHPAPSLMTVDNVLEFWARRNRNGQGMTRHYLRNFKQRFRVLGNPTNNHPAADEIIARLGG